MAHGAKIDKSLLQSLRSDEAGERLSALNEIATLGEKDAAAYALAQEVASMASDPEPQVQAAALLALGSMGETGNTHASLLEAYLLFGKDLQDVPPTKPISYHPVTTGVIGGIGEFDGSQLRADTQHVFMEPPFVRGPPPRFSSPESLLVRRAAARALGQLGEIAAPQALALESCLDSPYPELVADCCISLGALHHFSEQLVFKLDDENEEVVASACTALGHLNQCVSAVGMVGLAHASRKVQLAALNALAQMSPAQEFSYAAVDLLEDDFWCIRQAAARLLLHIGSGAANEVLLTNNIVRLFQHQNPGVRACAATALGSVANTGVPAADLSLVSALEQLLNDPSEDLSMKPLIALGWQKQAEVQLRKPACAAVTALSKLGGSTKFATAALQSKDLDVRILCVGALVEMYLQDGAYLDTIVKACKDPHPRVVEAACKALAAVAEGAETECLPPDAFLEAVDALSDGLRHTDPLVRAAAVRALAKLPDEAIEHLVGIGKLLQDKSSLVRVEAIWALKACGESGQVFAPHIAGLLIDESGDVRLAAVGVLGAMDYRGAAFADEVAALVQDPWPMVQVASLRYLGNLKARFRSVQVIEAISQASSDPMKEVRLAAGEASRVLLQ